MYAAAISPRGGVARRAAQLRGQGIIEYVLIIAIIGLVIVFAGPGVAGAIRNQFNLVGNTVNSGTSAGTEGGGASGGGSAGTASAIVQAAIAKDAKDWTLDEQEAVAEDIAAKGEASPAYAKAKAAMDAGTKFTMKLTDGQTLEYRIIGINHDDLADGSGKAGLTYWGESRSFENYGYHYIRNNDGQGWEKAEIRQRLNSGDLWKLLPSDLRKGIKSVSKETIEDNARITTKDKFFLISQTEIYGNSSDPDSGGYQYEYWTGKVFSLGTSFLKAAFCF